MISIQRDQFGWLDEFHFASNEIEKKHWQVGTQHRFRGSFSDVLSVYVCDGLARQRISRFRFLEVHSWSTSDAMRPNFNFSSKRRHRPQPPSSSLNVDDGEENERTKTKVPVSHDDHTNDELVSIKIITTSGAQNTNYCASPNQSTPSLDSVRRATCVDAMLMMIAADEDEEQEFS